MSSFDMVLDLTVFDRLQEATQGAIVKAIELTAEQTVSEAKNNIAKNESIGSGILLSSVTRTTAANGETLKIYTGSDGTSKIKAPDTSNNEIAATVGTPYKQGAFTEYGTKPHFPWENGDLPKSLIEWVHRKQMAGTYKNGAYTFSGGTMIPKRSRRLGGKARQYDEDRQVAFAIAQGISKKGTTPKPWLYPAFQIAKGMFGAFLEKTIREIRK